MDNVFGNHRGLEMYLDHASNGGMGVGDIGQFTFVWDLYLAKDQNDSLQCLWQGNADNANDGELFLDCRNGGFYVTYGGGYVGEDDWPLGGWFRLVHAVNFAENQNALYVNGEQVHLFDGGVDWLFGEGSDKPIWLLTDDGPDFRRIHCALRQRRQLLDRVLVGRGRRSTLGGPECCRYLHRRRRSMSWRLQRRWRW